jgi:peptidoglycan glycosyltransferase
MNRQIRHLGVVLVLCYLALFVQFNRIQIFQQDELQANPSNFRAIERDFSSPRGAIFTADGVIVARSVPAEGQFDRQRLYPEGDLYAHVTGFFSFEFGAEGVERVYNDELSGQAVAAQFGSLRDILTDTDTTVNLTLTVDDDLQRVAKAALGDRKGAVVALDPRDGAIQAFWGFPSYDPGVLSGVDLDGAAAEWDRLEALPNADDPRISRPYRERYFPGSTFKVVTAAAGLASDRLSPRQPDFEVVTEYTPPLTNSAIGNFGGSACGGTLVAILAQSCNSAFAELAAEVLGPQPLIETAERFGFNDAPPIDLPAPAASNFPTDFGAVVGTVGDPPVDLVEATPSLAQSAIGQFEVAATPLQMALVAAAVANEGVIMTPHLMRELTRQDGSQLRAYQPAAWRAALSSTDAATLRAAMEQVVQVGTAQVLAIPGAVVGAKTGTAEVTSERPDDTHAWVIAFAGRPGEAPSVAVAVLVESVPGQGQQTGGGVAAPIARDVIAAALGLG